MIVCPECGEHDIGPWMADPGPYLNWCEDCYDEEVSRKESK